jgi:DNA primase
VAQAQPLWAQLPVGLLREQLLSELADLARLPREELARRFAPKSTAAGASAIAPAAAGTAPPWRSRGQARARAPARLPQDQVARMLLQRCDWWGLLSSDEHDLLVALPGWHADLFRWLERWLADHGPASWTELREAVRDEPWGEQALALVDGAELQVEPQEAELHAALAQTRKARETLQALKLLGRA